MDSRGHGAAHRWNHTLGQSTRGLGLLLSYFPSCTKLPHKLFLKKDLCQNGTRCAGVERQGVVRWGRQAPKALSTQWHANKDQYCLQDKASKFIEDTKTCIPPAHLMKQPQIWKVNSLLLHTLYSPSLHTHILQVQNLPVFMVDDTSAFLTIGWARITSSSQWDGSRMWVTSRLREWKAHTTLQAFLSPCHGNCRGVLTLRWS